MIIRAMIDGLRTELSTSISAGQYETVRVV